MCRSAVNDGSCSPWVMCSVVRGNQIRDSDLLQFLFFSTLLHSHHSDKCSSLSPYTVPKRFWLTFVLFLHTLILSF